MQGITTEDLGKPFSLRLPPDSLNKYIYVLTESGYGDGSGNDISFRLYQTRAYTTKEKAVVALAKYLKFLNRNNDSWKDIWDTEYWSDGESEEEEDGSISRKKQKRAYRRQAFDHITQQKSLVLNSDSSHKIKISVVKLDEPLIN